MQFYSYVISTKTFSLFFGYWIEKTDIWIRRITYTKKILKNKRVKMQVLEVLDWVRSQSLSFLTGKAIKKQHSFLIFMHRIYLNKSCYN